MFYIYINIRVYRVSCVLRFNNNEFYIILTRSKYTVIVVQYCTIYYIVYVYIIIYYYKITVQLYTILYYVYIIRAQYTCSPYSFRKQ